MIIPQNEYRWYALRVKSNREKLVAAALRYKGYEPFLPLYRTQSIRSDRLKGLELPLFSGYVFCRMDAAHRLPALTIPGAVSFVGVRNTPMPIDDNEIKALQAIIGSEQPVAPWPFLEVGQRVRIERGPLREIEGIIADLKNDFRLVVSVELLQRSVAVTIDRTSIMPVPHLVKPGQASGLIKSSQERGSI